MTLKITAPLYAARVRISLQGFSSAVMNHTQSYHVDQSAVQKAPRNKNTEYRPNSTEYWPLREGSH